MREAALRLGRRVVLATLVASGLWRVLPVRAETVQADTLRSDASGPIKAPINRLYTALEQTMRAGKTTPFPERFNALAPVVEQVFDLETVLKVSIGPGWYAMDPTTQATLLTSYQRFTVATYVANFDTYDGERFKILPGLRASGNDRIVGTEIVGAKGDTTRLDYLMRDERGTWRAVDVLLDGTISRVAVQRSDFRKILATGNAGALIASLRKKIDDLSDGTLHS